MSEPTPSTAAEKLRDYHVAFDDGEMDIAAKLWREYLELVEQEMRKKERAA